MPFSEAAQKELQQVVTRYPDKRSAMLPALEIAQREQGYLTPEAYEWVAEALDTSPTWVASVASFYTMLRKEPVGRYLVQVCTNLSCSLLGAQPLLLYLQEKLGIEVGETTPDGLFTLVTVECLGSCATAPVMQINDRYYERLTRERIDEILTALRAEAGS
ncbi:MAG TPA: NADH-quinone oxidoreductase subunit NuoE [Anaerolineae bacterium]|nr:NADH-quinone oxidoreductase subunit NuoE [Anaerolineae bacterium]HOQ98382.1 NADH-quinone oxidoreductase subunit NuoE [Anaerolineae bacterium]